MSDKDKKSSQTAWSGRFDEPVDEIVKRYTASVDFDYQLAEYDIEGSIAHAEMLCEQEIISDADLHDIKRGLIQIRTEIHNGDFNWSIDYEDVHLNIEHRLTELIGDAGKKLHTARSRNDQVATDIRLYVRDQVDLIIKLIHQFQSNLLNLAEQHVQTVMPGLTHLQVAQPISFAHHLMAYFEMTKRDAERFHDLRKRVNRLPLGSGALAGTTFKIDRLSVAKKLGFDGVCENSLDAVSDRDFAIEFCIAAALLMTHLSRLSEELILWMSPQFNFIEIADRFCTGSSMMPQKKNPDVPELVRGKTGRVYGHVVSLLTLMKGQPLAYNKDNQEDKEPLFDTAQTIRDTLLVYADMLTGITVNKQAMRDATARGFATATDLADHLVRQGLPFRESHEVVAKAVKTASQQNVDIIDLTIEELQNISPLISKEMVGLLSPEQALESRNHIGGTGSQAVMSAISNARKLIA
ncbi:MAG: argininosuccinate lyase [Proteobacteria bacterium]|nr:argininosuccinate lyase [Pseudomonadota bacterium]